MVVFTGAMAARLKTPQEREQLRRSLHKSAASPAWKTAYRKVHSATYLLQHIGEDFKWH